ncbi:MAG: nuclear transport factor 2 family protein [Actinomycetia bacterium]|nr:nuclear transport factor 2 family protein [Actinomycetes bacterium]MCP4961172.1 nuclear transport factor 2 family protein [Actinomycetes bacterium]
MTDQQDIQETIQTYFECMYESSAEKARTAFHPSARITGYLEDGLHEMSVDDFAGFVASQQPSAHQQGKPKRLEITSLEISGATAMAQVVDDFLGLTFTDSLALLKTEGRWQIYNKLFHVQGPAS